MRKEIKNLPASVHDRLKRLAVQRGRPFQELLYYYSIERFLYRFSKSPYANNFILKGGLMFIGWGIQLRRPTRDIDIQGYISNTMESLVNIAKDICLQDVEPDGMWFDADSVKGEQIMNAADYQGTRIYFTGFLGRASIYLHLDVSFANVVTPQEMIINYPSLLGMPEFKIRGYPYETAIAEKFQAMVVLNRINDRMKDFYDVWLLSQRVDVQGINLVKAIRATFTARRTPLPDHLPTALSEEFARQKQPDWDRFLERSLLSEMDDIQDFSLVIDILRQFLWPAMLAASSEAPFEMTWRASGIWQ